MSLAALGWSPFFDDQITADETGCLKVRVATVHRARMSGISQDGPIKIRLLARSTTADFAVGDWI